jgi:hypothetical protein
MRNTKNLNDAIAAIEKAKNHFSQDEYSKLRNEREKATFSMMMRMNPEALTNIRKEFFARRDSVTLDEFIYIIQVHLINRKGDHSFVMSSAEQREFGTNMYELFKDIDVNGDGQLEWQVKMSWSVRSLKISLVLFFVGIYQFYCGKGESFEQACEIDEYRALP